MANGGSDQDAPSVTVRVAAAGDETGRTIEVHAHERVVIGRAPGAARLGDEDASPTREVRIDAASVSANHVTLSIDEGALCVQDVGSRNGTWLRLPERTVVRVPTQQPIALRLGLPTAAERSDDEPHDARWSDEAEFAYGIAHAVSDWFQGLGIATRVNVGPRAAGAVSSNPAQIPLADGSELSVRPIGTVETDWTQALATLWRYVARQNRLYESESSAREEGMILASDAIRRAYRTVIDAAARGARILLTGPSGSGKEELARCYHRATSRSGPFVARNCAMFNKEFLRSELFGAEAGSFTGATHRIMGAVERAHGGTLFLDEIGDMPLDVQPMLLRFLDRAEYERVGGYGQSRAADVKLVCATNKDLRAASLRGDFRADLWFRVSIQVVEVPPLRERLDDVVAYLQRRELAPGMSAYDALAVDGRQLALQHRWDGNFRELANFVERLPHETRPGGIDVSTCRRALELGALEAPSTRPAVGGAAPGSLDGWAELAATAVRAFAADYGQTTPATWDEVKDLIEKYLKPLLFAHLTGIGSDTERGSVDIGALAGRIDADRGTVQKQLVRYLERFGR